MLRLYLNGEEGVYDPVDHGHGGHGGHHGHHQHSSKSRKSGGAPRPSGKLQEALESVMYDVMKIRLKRRDATRN